MSDDNVEPQANTNDNNREDIEMMDRPDDVDSNLDAEEDEESHDMFQLIHELSGYLCSVQEDGEEVAAGFQRIPNRRLLPDYFDIITDPIAFSTIRGKTQKKQYTAFSEFVEDVARICHNAQVYNRPSAPIFNAADRLRDIFKLELHKLSQNGDITSDDAKLPDLGELPPAEDSPPRVPEIANIEEISEEEDEDQDDEEEEDEEESEDEEDSDDENRVYRNRRRQQLSHSQRRENDGADNESSYKKRGRPPMVLTPIEARISSILKGLRKMKDNNGRTLVGPFEKLPDKIAVPDYYRTITNPIALDNIKKKAKRKKYKNVDDALKDIELMFENAKLYNEDESQVHHAAIELQQHARVLAEQEKAKPDDSFRDDDGKLPLPEIRYNGDMWRVGDWVHIRNPNDLAKPIVAQIYRTWQDREGQKWINACWYYRPEQTVHRFEKYFYEHEVVKTGQYRDHQIGEVIDRCFVMFVTRFNRGRPRGFPPDKDVYVCESRYNEEKFRFNKIKTWASCVPDEVRDKDYEMDLFEVPHQMRKIPSPIKHLLREDAKDIDELPRPTWGSPNAPPIVGAVHCRPPEPNETPPVQAVTPTPTHIATEIPPESTQRGPILPGSSDRTSDMTIRSGPMALNALVVPSPNQYHGHATLHYQSSTPVGGTVTHQTPVPAPHPSSQTLSLHASMRTIPYQYQNHQPTGYSPKYGHAYPHSPAALMTHQPLSNPRVTSYGPASGSTNMRQAVSTPSSNPQSHSNMYNPPRPPEVYTLPDNINETLPSSIRRGFQHDDAGRVLFFTSPPLDRLTEGLSPGSIGLGHSIKYLAGRNSWLSEREKKRKDRACQTPVCDIWESVTSEKDGQQDSVKNAHAREAAEAVDNWFLQLDKDTKTWTKDVGLDDWNSSAKSNTSF